MTYESMDYSEYLKQKKEISEAKQAAVRCWAVVIGHLFLPPVSSLYYAVKTNHWKPTWIATGIAAVTIPLAVVDAGITLSLAPPITSAAMIISNTTEKRRKLQVFGPEQADHIRYNLEK
jgi:hypothetical protein